MTPPVANPSPPELTSFFLQEAGENPHDKGARPFSASKTSNWVARAGGLPHYIQHVAHALVKNGHDTSKAISMAVGIVRNWAEGKGHVHPAIKAAAAKAIAEWEAKRGAAHATSAAKSVAKVGEDWSDLTPVRRVEEAYFVLLDVGSGLGGERLGEMLAEAKLSSKARDALAASDFAIPGKRAYPIHDESHARNALARAAGKPEEATVKAAVKKRYPKIGKAEEEARERGEFELLVAEAAALIEAAPKWMLPIAATRPGFKPLKPEKKKGSSTNSEFNRLHPRGTGAQGGRFVRKGSSGAEVSAVQRRLGISETGTYGGHTIKRVERFQKNHGLQVDGVVGTQTVAALRGQAGAKKVAPGALTKGDRRYLRRYTRRTSPSSGGSSTMRPPRSTGGGSSSSPRAGYAKSGVPGGASGPSSTIIHAGTGSTGSMRRKKRTGYARGGVVV